MTQELSRRSFLLGSTTLGAAALAASTLGLAPQMAHADEADDAEAPAEVSATYDCDFVVCLSLIHI